MREYFISILQGIIYPDARLMVVLLAFIFIDLLTGIRKSKKKGITTKSAGLRMTIDKATSYFSFLLCVFLLANISKPGTDSHFAEVILDNSLNALFLASIYIEFKSILENIMEANPDSDLVKYVIRPLHNIIILKFKTLPFQDVKKD
jgi:hypothetical protein